MKALTSQSFFFVSSNMMCGCRYTEINALHGSNSQTVSYRAGSTVKTQEVVMC